MADSNAGTSQPAAAPSQPAVAASQPAAAALQPAEKTPLGKLGDKIHGVLDFGWTTALAMMHLIMQPYIFFWQWAQSCFGLCKDVVAIFTMSIRALNLYLQVFIRFLTGLNKDEKPAETIIKSVKDMAKAADNALKMLCEDPRPRGWNARTVVKMDPNCPPILESDESESESGNVGESQSTSGTSGDADQPRPPSGNGSGSGGSGSNGSSSGGNNGGTGSGGAPAVNGQGKAKGTVASNPEVQEKPASNGVTNKPSSGSTNQGVDEVDQSGKKTTASGATAASPKV